MVSRRENLRGGEAGAGLKAGPVLPGLKSGGGTANAIYLSRASYTEAQFAMLL